MIVGFGNNGGRKCMDGMTRWLLAGWLLLVPAMAWAGEGDALLAEVDRKLRPESSESFRRFINILPDKTRLETVVYTAFKSGRIQAAVIIAPQERKGTALLRTKNGSLWLYLPDKKEIKKARGNASFVGGAFNNDDILRSDFHVDYSAEIKEVGDKETLLELTPKQKGGTYERARMWVNMRTSMPSRVAYYSPSGVALKEVFFAPADKLKGGYIRPPVLKTGSRLNARYRSEMHFGEIKMRDLPDEVFTLGFLERLVTLVK